MNTALTNLTWLPPYEVNRHQRAKHVKLRYSVRSGLRVTVPTRFSLKQLPAVFELHKDWIVEQCEKHPIKPLSLPSALHLPLVNGNWVIRYETKVDRPRLRELKSGVLLINANQEEALALLKKWIRRKAKQRLPPLFHALSDALCLPYLSLSIRAQQNVWGSCSLDRSIRLNDKLLFFPPILAKHIMIHELCHTKIMNHSRDFWGLVASYDPDYKNHRKQCRTYQSHLPIWLS